MHSGHLQMSLKDGTACLSSWLAFWRPSCLTTWLTDWLTDWLPDCLTACLPDWLTDWLTSFFPVWLPGCLTTCLTNWLTGWLAGSLIHSHTPAGQYVCYDTLYYLSPEKYTLERFISKEKVNNNSKMIALNVAYSNRYMFSQTSYSRKKK